MSNRTSNSNSPGDNARRSPAGAEGALPADLSRAAAIRAAADGELPADRVSPQDAPRLAFEQGLRRAVDRVTPDTKCPAPLRTSIEQMFREHAQTSEQIDTVGGDRSRSFWNRTTRWAAVAAMLALCTTVIVMSARSGSRGVGPFGGPQAALRVASFVERETDACAEINQHFDQKFVARSPEEARRLADSIFQTVPAALIAADEAIIAEGYHFAGFGRCVVPGPGASAHLIYHADTGSADPLSLFIQEASPAAALDSACCYRLDGRKPDDDRVMAWRDDAFIYYLFSRSDRALQAARTAFGAPTHEITVR